MTSLNKDSTFEREELSEMLSAGRKAEDNDIGEEDDDEESIGGNSRRKAN